MEIKVRVMGKLVRFHISLFSYIVKVEVDGESVYSTSELMVWTMFYELLAFGMGVFFGMMLMR